MDTNKLSDVFEMALKNTYVATTEELLMHSGMCSAIYDLYQREYITYKTYDKALDYIHDFIDEMEMLEKLPDDGFMFLYESLTSFKGYDTELLQYLVWETIIEKLRSQGR